MIEELRETVMIKRMSNLSRHCFPSLPFNCFAMKDKEVLHQRVRNSRAGFMRKSLIHLCRVVQDSETGDLVENTLNINPQKCNYPTVLVEIVVDGVVVVALYRTCPLTRISVQRLYST